MIPKKLTLGRYPERKTGPAKKRRQRQYQN